MSFSRSKGCTSTGHSVSHYTDQAVSLLDQCQKSLKPLLEEAPRRSHPLTKLKKVLEVIDNLLSSYLRHFTESLDMKREHVSMKERVTAVQVLKIWRTLRQDIENANSKQDTLQDSLYYSHDQRNSLYEHSSAKTAVDTLLFRLIVSLDLLLVRVDDAHYVMLGRREVPTAVTRPYVGILPAYVLILGWCTGVTYFANFNRRSRTTDSRQWIILTTKAAGAVFSSLQLVNGMARCWMRDKIVRSTNDLMEWTLRWKLIHRRTCLTSVSAFRSIAGNNSLANRKELLGLDDKTRTLIEHAMRHVKKSYFWRSTGEIRFLMLKRFMDIYYASVGTAISTKQTSTLALPLVIGAAASFYTLTGVSEEALTSFVNDSSLDLIKHAW
jgi:hypothetical protein